MRSFFKFLLIGAGSLLMLGAQCNRGVRTEGTGTGSEGDEAETGTVAVESCTGADDTASLKLGQNPATRVGPASSFKVRFYDVDASTSTDCAAAEAAGSFVSLLDGGTDTSDCKANMNPATYDTSTFTDIVGGTLLGEGAIIPAGEYHCLRFTFCDHMYWKSTDPTVQTYCTVTEDIQDVHRCYDDPTTGQELCFEAEETDGVATIRSYYVSTTGGFADTEDDTAGTVEIPAPLQNPLIVEAGARTTVSFVVSTASPDGTADDGIFVYDEGHGSDCKIAPGVIEIVHDASGLSLCSVE